MKERRRSRKRNVLFEIFQYVGLIVCVLLFSFVIQTYVIMSFKVSGSSMYPTFKDGERIMMYRLSGVNRFDVVVVDSPDETYEVDASGNSLKDIFGNRQRRMYIKRIIGLPGDSLAYKDDTLWINDVKYDELYLSTARHLSQQQGQFYMEDATLKEIIDGAKQISPTLPAGNTTLLQKDGKWIIPQDYYFVLGDNRHNSKDSEEYGLVHKSLIKGVAILRFWPFDSFGISPFGTK